MNTQKLQIAKERELRNCIDNDVYVTVPNENQKCITLGGVLSIKGTTESLQTNTCLVAFGFENNCLNKSKKESPNYSKDTLHTISAVTVQNDWYLRSTDIKTAFLQGEQLNQNIFIKPSASNYSPENIWKLKKCAYGLSDASLKFYTRRSFSLSVSKFNPTLSI